MTRLSYKLEDRLSAAHSMLSDLDRFILQTAITGRVSEDRLTAVLHRLEALKDIFTNLAEEAR